MSLDSRADDPMQSEPTWLSSSASPPTSNLPLPHHLRPPGVRDPPPSSVSFPMLMLITLRHMLITSSDMLKKLSVQKNQIMQLWESGLGIGLKPQSREKQDLIQDTREDVFETRNWVWAHPESWTGLANGRMGWGFSGWKKGPCGPPAPSYLSISSLNQCQWSRLPMAQQGAPG